MADPKSVVSALLDEAGIRVNGPEPWDIQVHDGRLYPRMLAWKNLGLGEAYMQGWWDCPRVDEFISRILRAGLANRVKRNWRLLLGLAPYLLLNLQSLSRASIVAKRHYGLDAELFGAFLDPYRQYSCAYFRDTDDLAEAQRRKMRLVCDKLGLRPGERLLDIGCGWGGLARFAAEEYGCAVVGINISKEQIAFAREFCAGLPVEILARDYRRMDEPFGKIVSVGMFEHVGSKNYREFMEVAARCLKPGGVFLLHTIGSNETIVGCDPWITRHIFPNGHLPSMAEIARAVEGLLVVEDWHNLGPHYDRTLMCWNERFQAAWPSLAPRHGETFRRMWEYYLQSCAGAFRARDLQLWQIAFTHTGSEQPCCRLA